MAMAAASLSAQPEFSAPLEGLARPRDLIAFSAKTLRMPKRLRLSEWADTKFYLSPESAAEPGRWRTIPYQRGIMDAITEPAVRQVTVRKSARIGWTKMLDATIGFYMEQDPCPILAVQPTVEDAEGFSKEEIDPMLRDCPALRNIVRDAGKKKAANTILHKKFPGGVLSMVGANSGRGFRRVSRRVIALDEVDAYPPSAGDDGDPINLAIKRSEYYWDRKILIGSTPLVAGGSRIEEEFEKGDQRRYYVPCPHCGHMDFLTFSEQTGEDARGHWMAFDTSSPEAAKASAHFLCRGCGCEIGHEHKQWMVKRGEWRADRPFRGHASFAIWAAYSYSPNATWGDIAAEFLEAKKGGPEKLKTFVNTVLGETWVEKGEAPEWRRLFDRREDFHGVVPRDALFLTAGVDVQADRLVYEVVAWMDDFQSWSLEADVIMGDTAKAATWAKLDELLARSWPGADGLDYQIRVLAVDSGYNTQTVYNWARKKPRAIACKGSATAKTLLGQPTPVDVKFDGKRIARGCKVWPVGVDMVKTELYGWLGLDPPTDPAQPFPVGYCHFSRNHHGEEFFKQLTAEQRVKHVRKGGFVSFDWTIIPGRQNHNLDCRVYARAAANRCGLDRIVAAASARRRAASPVEPAAPARPHAPATSAPSGEGGEGAQASEPRRPRSGWLGGRGGASVGRGADWFRRRR